MFLTSIKKENTRAWWKQSDVQVLLVLSCFSTVNRSALTRSTSVTPPATLSGRKSSSSNTSEWAGEVGGWSGSQQQGVCFSGERSHISTCLSTSFSNTNAAQLATKGLCWGCSACQGSSGHLRAAQCTLDFCKQRSDTPKVTPLLYARLLQSVFVWVWRGILGQNKNLDINWNLKATNCIISSARWQLLNSMKKQRAPPIWATMLTLHEAWEQHTHTNPHTLSPPKTQQPVDHSVLD